MNVELGIEHSFDLETCRSLLSMLDVSCHSCSLLLYRHFFLSSCSSWVT